MGLLVINTYIIKEESVDGFLHSPLDYQLFMGAGDLLIPQSLHLLQV